MNHHEETLASTLIEILDVVYEGLSNGMELTAKSAILSERNKTDIENILRYVSVTVSKDLVNQMTLDCSIASKKRKSSPKKDDSEDS